MYELDSKRKNHDVENIQIQSFKRNTPFGVI